MIYRPLTSTPFKQNSEYQEIEPCRMLQPYVRCFWGGEHDFTGIEMDESYEIMIPDTCVDIIYVIDDTGYIMYSDFVGINDRGFISPKNYQTEHREFVFAIRFYAWSAYVFCEDSFTGTVNGCFDVRERFSWLDRALRDRLSEPESLPERVRLAETLLLQRLENRRENAIVDNVMYDILRHQGALEISRLSKENFISSRQMERLFHEYIGLTPKKLSNLVRYQNLWRDIVSQPHFNMMDAVHKYGYTDLPHMLREFERYHCMNIRAAKKVALESVLKDVGNIQDIKP